jgi:pimeloyl-ACP methyl ester carboxylesterase
MSAMKALLAARPGDILRKSIRPGHYGPSIQFRRPMYRIISTFRKLQLITLLLALTGKAYALVLTLKADSLREEMINIGFHQLFISSNGPQDAQFTVVFESGAGGSSTDWTAVRRLLPATLRTIAYDRAGVGKSEAGPLPRTMAQEVVELHHLLEKAHIKGPLILVGQSIGGLLVRLYTEQYGGQVKGLVLVDPTHESSVLGSMKYGGWVRLREKAVGKTIPTPQLILRRSAGYDSTADYMAEEFQLLYRSRLKRPQPFADRPLVVIGAGSRKQPPGTPDEQWKLLRAERDDQIRELTGLSRNSTFILDSNSGHMVQHDNPAVVVQAIERVIQALETGRKP